MKKAIKDTEKLELNFPKMTILKSLKMPQFLSMSEKKCGIN